MTNHTIHISGDHAGFALKEQLKIHFPHVSWIDLGPNSEESCDYPDFAHQLAQQVSEKQGKGILICGSGNGVCITANKHKGIRAALCWNPELATLAVQHNNANVLCLPARFVDTETAFNIVIAFMDATFEGGRHQRRIDKIEI